MTKRGDGFLVLKRSEEIRSESPPFFAGHRGAIAAGSSLCQYVADPASSLSSLRVLISGWPGSGKTVYPAALVANVNRIGCPYAYVFMRCARIAAEPVEDTLIYLQEAANFLGSLDSAALVTFDELDALAPARRAHPALLRLSMWVMDLLEADSLPVPTVILGITNDPLQVDKAIRDRFEADLYFARLEDEVLCQMLANRGVPDPEKVLRALHERLPDCILTGRTMYQGIALVEVLVDVKTTPPEEIADLLFTYIAPVSQEELREYEHSHRLRIEKSQMFIEQWAKKSKP